MLNPRCGRVRLEQGVLIVSILGLSWLGMMAAHEAGHVAFGWACGARVERVVLHPLAISRTDVTHNHHPLFVAWGGPIFGVILPLAGFGVAKAFQFRADYLIQFFAGFCLIANGLYLGVGTFGNVGDAGDLAQHGAPPWVLVLFGLATVPFGFVLWNGLGRYYGLGPARRDIDRRVAWTTLFLLLIVIAVELLV